MRPFELGVLISFAVIAMVSLMLISRGPSDSGSDIPEVTRTINIWGVLPASVVNTAVSALTEENESYRLVNYSYVPAEGFHDRLILALADGLVPDLIIYSHEQLVEIRSRVQPFSYELAPLRDFSDRYVDGAQIFALKDGVYALPLMVDPMMMYWNRDQLTNAGYLAPPTTWEELVSDYVPTLVERDEYRSVTRSVVSFGGAQNTRNVFGVLSTLLLQGGSRLVTEEGRKDEYRVGIQFGSSGDANPLINAIDFYMRFSDPSNALYSWNQTFPQDRTAFAAEDLLFYFGYGSEAREIEKINPNLNFDIAEMPQSGGDTVRRTYGRFYGIAQLRATTNPDALTVLMSLARGDVAAQMAEAAGMAPVARALLAASSNDKYGRLIYSSAIMTHGWLSPGATISDSVFVANIAALSENRSSVTAAASDITTSLKAAY